MNEKSNLKKKHRIWDVISQTMFNVPSRFYSDDIPHRFDDNTEHNAVDHSQFLVQEGDTGEAVFDYL